jgi:thiamine biosynthesis lipoprotein
MKYNFQQARHVLGSEGVLTIVAEDQAETEAVFEELWDQIDSFEARFSRFQPDSELTQFNNHSGQKVPVSRAFISLATAAKDMSRITDGLYNPLILPALQRAGYLGSWPEADKSRPGTDFRNGTVVTADHLEIGDDWAKIPRGAALDFGGCGKGYMLDKLGAALVHKGLTDYWLSLGGDILCSGYGADGKPWTIGIQDLHHPDNSIAGLTNSGQMMAIATSGTAKRQGAGWHHIIDPRTGKPSATDAVTATVRCATGLEADVFAKCLVLLGSSDSAGFAEKVDIQQFIIQQMQPTNNVISWGIT